MSEPDLPPEGPPPSADDEFPEVRRRLWDLEWRLRRESGSVADKLAEVLKLVFQAPGWSGEAVAEGLMPALADLKKRVIALETKATEGTAPQHPAFVALAERVEILERLVEEGVAAQRAAISDMADRLAGLEGRLAGVESWGDRLAGVEAAAGAAAAEIEELARTSEDAGSRIQAHEDAAGSLGARLGDHEGRLVDLGSSLQQSAEALIEARERLGEHDARLAQESAERRDEFRLLREVAETTDGMATDLDERVSRLETKGAHRDLALEETAGDLVARVGYLEGASERQQRELGDKVPSAQFAGVSLSMGTQQAAIKDIKAQLAALRSGGPLPPVAPEDAAAAAAPGTSADTEQVQALWDHLGRLEERIAGMMPEFDRIAKDLAESKRGLKGVLSNWIELESKLSFYAEKRLVSQLEARIPPAEALARLESYEGRVAALEDAALALQDGLREIAAIITGNADE